jgi:hypothetical protein
VEERGFALSATVAALFVEKNGVYAGIPDVDVWDESRDARLYAGPWPVVAHPPCNRWSPLAYLNQAQHGYRVGDDGGCFHAALTALRRFGGVLEHPAKSLAWRRFDLPRPTRNGWTQSLFEDGWATEVSQSAYGLEARKRTWLYYIGPEPPALDWSDPPVTATVGGGGWLRPSGRRDASTTKGDGTRLQGAEASRTPEGFRDALLAMARSVAYEAAA